MPVEGGQALPPVQRLGQGVSSAGSSPWTLLCWRRGWGRISLFWRNISAFCWGENSFSDSELLSSLALRSGHLLLKSWAPEHLKNEVLQRWWTRVSRWSKEVFVSQLNVGSSLSTFTSNATLHLQIGLSISEGMGFEGNFLVWKRQGGFLSPPSFGLHVLVGIAVVLEKYLASRSFFDYYYFLRQESHPMQTYLAVPQCRRPLSEVIFHGALFSTCFWQPRTVTLCGIWWIMAFD